MRNGRKVRTAAMMVAAAVITVAAMAQAAPRRYDTGDPGAGSRLPAVKARSEFLAGKRASDATLARRAFLDAARMTLLRIKLRY